MGESINTQPFASKEERWEQANLLSAAVPDSSEKQRGRGRGRGGEGEGEGGKEGSRREESTTSAPSVAVSFRFHLDCK